MQKFQKLLKPETEKDKQQQQILILLLIAGIGYYFFIYLDRKRTETKSEIRKLFQANPTIFVSELDASLWKFKENWEEYLDSLYLGSQISQFSRKIKEAIEEQKAINNDEKGRRKKAIKDLEDNCSLEEKNWPTMKKIIESYSKKIKKARVNDISTLQKEVNELIVEERVKKQGLHWRRKLVEKHSWADKWLVDNVQTFETAWARMKDIMNREPEHFNVAASYKIKFPPSLWNDLTEEQKAHKKANELKLKDEVQNYKFSSLIEEWERKTKLNPVRGELDPNNLADLDNNALFYGASRTGKSVMAEKLAYEADVYPLVVIQGSTLTPRKIDYDAGIDPLAKFIFTLCDIDFTLTDDFNFKREENGEVRYILFVDEANQITTSTLISKSTELTFLKECMGSDSKREESKNLWIMATNHLDQIDAAVYQSGRLSNPLCFSWTLGDFMNYAKEVGISSKFPDRWIDNKTLGDEDNKWVNRFNKIIFDKEFLPFWEKFISTNPDAEYEPERDEQIENQEQKKLKIKWGEMFEFFWRLYDSKQLGSFEGKFDNPRQPKIEEVLGTRLKELTMSLEDLKRKVEYSGIEYNETIEQKIGELIEQIRK